MIARLRRMLAIALMVWPAAVAAQPAATVGIDEHLGGVIPLDAVVRDSDAVARPLRALLNENVPVVLVLAYYNCPMLCDAVLGGLTAPLRDLRVRLGVDYRVFALSIDPDDTPLAARNKAEALLGALPPIDRARWRVLVGDHGSGEAVARAVGFRYVQDRASGQFAHAAAIIVLSPDGRVAQYLYGVRFTAPQLAAALDTARAGKVQSTIDRILVRCFQYAPALRRHRDTLRWFFRGGGMLVFGSLACGLVWLIRREGGRR